MLKELSVEEFVREVASQSPAPGGGSVAALAGAQAAGLLSMYCNLSQNREKLGDAVEALRETGEEARFLKTRLLEAIDEDTLAFNQVMDAYRMPKESGEEKTLRSGAIQEATRHASDVPLQTARGSLRVLSLIYEVAARGNPAAITDLGVANLQGYSGLVGACYNVRVNLGNLKNREEVDDFVRETGAILKEGRALFEKNRTIIEEALG